MNAQHTVDRGRSQNRLLAVWLLLFSLCLCAEWTRAETGVQAWVQRYSHVTDSYDQARKVVTDTAGNVIVAGNTDEGITGADMLIIKYTGAGVPLWTNRYGTGSSYGAQAVGVDGSGNVFVTGSSLGDYATIAYSGAGVPLWTNRYNSGPANSDDDARALAVDGSGNVFVTGTSFGGGSWADYATIKYSGAGVPLWTNRYNGGDDWANALAVDGSGNVFVTGGSYDSGSVNADYATIKYSGAGVPLWTNRYNGSAQALAVDGSGNVFVTGDYATIKYSGAGVPLWTNRYNGSFQALAVDGIGNVFVTGFSHDSGGVSADYATIAYSGAGVPLWTNRYNGGDDWANAVAVDGSGNVFVTGYSYDSNESGDYVTIAYSGAGVPLWTNRYNGPGNGSDIAQAVAVDGSGNVFVTGGSASYPYNFDYVTIKYSGAGVPLWTNRYNGPANGYDWPQGLALGPDGSAYVTGGSSGGSGFGLGGIDLRRGSDIATIKYISVPVLTLERDGGGGFFIHVNGVPNVTYRLQRAPSVTGTWSNIATNTAPGSGLIEHHETSPLPGPAFYRAVTP